MANTPYTENKKSSTNLMQHDALPLADTQKGIASVTPVVVVDDEDGILEGKVTPTIVVDSQEDDVDNAEGEIQSNASYVGNVLEGADTGAAYKFALEREMDSKKNLRSMEQTHVSTRHYRPRRTGRKLSVNQPANEEEDICFVCFDGGKLILCDKRSCPKAYHMECTGRDSEFFQRKGEWFCGWHLCNYCSRFATRRCYMCPTAFCSGCLGEADFVCVRKDQGLCEVCYPIVYMIEHNQSINEDGVKVDFSDQETYECLFKEYWEDLKQKLSLTSEELDRSCKTRKGGEPLENSGNDTESIKEKKDGSSIDSDARPARRRLWLSKRKRLTSTAIVDVPSGSDYEGRDEEDEEKIKKARRGRKKSKFNGWASRELLELIHSVRDDPKKPLSRLEVNKLLWEYVEANKLLNPQQSGQILCDKKLQRLFGKKKVGRFEMMKLLSSHLASGDEAVGLDNSLAEKQQKSRRIFYDKKFWRPNAYQYAAIDGKNINLIYLKRSLLDELRNDPQYERKVAGTFVRIRVTGMANKSDMCYRLVQVLGMKQTCDPENPKRETQMKLEILNLQKREEITADLVSNEDFTEEECQRLRQSVRYGFLKAMTVGELEEKAKSLHEIKVKDRFETELLRLSHLRDKASEKGRKKELSECVEKLSLLSNPEEKERWLKAPVEINADPRMDPNYTSEDENMSVNDNQGS